jgi:hypothetical protein
MNGGYQKFVLSLAARLTLWRLSAGPRPDAFLLDEGFGACSADSLAGIVQALEALAATPGGPRLVFLVTHVEALHVRLERALEITTAPSPGGTTSSRITNLSERELADRRERERATAEARRAAPQARAARIEQLEAPRAGDTAAVALPPDPARPGHVHCAVCRQSIGAGHARQHLVSAKHAAAVQKAAAARVRARQ